MRSLSTAASAASSVTGSSSRYAALGLFLLGVLGALGFAPRTAAAQPFTLVEVPLAPGSSPAGISAGPDGNVWFVEEHGDRVGKVTPSLAVTEFPTVRGGFARGITNGPDGALWFTELTGRIGRVTPAGQVTEAALPAPPNEPIEIVTGSDGFLWFTDYYDRIGRLDPSPGGGVFRIPLAAGFRPQGITRGADGNIWFTEAQPTQTGSVSGRIGRISLTDPDTANVTEFPLPDPTSGPWGICAGPDGNIWFTEIANSRIGRITPAGDVTEFQLPGGSQPYGITAGSDGNLWFTESTPGFSRIGRITPAGVITEMPLPNGGGPTEIASGPDGNIWFTEFNGDRIGMVRLSTCVSDGKTLCLNGGRFQARITWSVPLQGTSGTGNSIPLTSDTGAFWFFSANNLELVVKVVDGRPVNGKFWVFAGVLTNVQYTLTVTDTQTGAVRLYEHAEGSLESFADTGAF